VDGRQPPAVDRPPGLPDWFQTLGRGAWLLVGIAALLTEEALRILGTLVETLLAGLLSGLSSATVLIMGSSPACSSCCS
jgi:hypothetical protein